MVSIVPQKYFVDKIAGDLADVSVMVLPGASPATYEPKPKQMLALTKAQLYFSIGVPFETTWLPRFAAASPHMTVVDTIKRIQKRDMVGHDHGGELAHDGKQGHGIKDPHVWLAPSLVRLQADSIRDALIAYDPKHALIYRHNHDAFVQEIHVLDKQLSDVFAKTDHALSFLVFHPSWGYFAESYGLTQHAIEVSGKSPSPKDLAKVIAEAREEHISVVFAQPEFSQKSADQVAKAIGGHVMRLSPLAYDWPKNLLAAAKAFQGSNE